MEVLGIGLGITCALLDALLCDVCPIGVAAASIARLRMHQHHYFHSPDTFLRLRKGLSRTGLERLQSLHVHAQCTLSI